MTQQKIIQSVASAIWRQRVTTAAKNGVDLSIDDEDFMIAANSIVDEARAAIDAYEAAKIAALSDTYAISVPGYGDYTVTQSDFDKPDGPTIDIVKVS